MIVKSKGTNTSVLRLFSMTVPTNNLHGNSIPRNSKKRYELMSCNAGCPRPIFGEKISKSHETPCEFVYILPVVKSWDWKVVV